MSGWGWWLEAEVMDWDRERWEQRRGRIVPSPYMEAILR